MNKKSLIIGLLSVGAVSVPGTALVAAQLNSAPSYTVPSATTTSSVTAAQADQIAINAVGGGTVQSTSNDTYQGAAVYDIHVLYNSSVYDVKVSQSSGAVVLKKLSSEQPSTPESTSSSSGSSSNSESESNSSTNSGSSTSTTAPIAGVTYGVKLTTVPSQFQTFVNQALTQESGSLKWVRFSTKENNQTQMNVKINLANGNTVKVIDVFSSSLQLLSQSINS